MKHAVVLIACTAALAACNKGPDINVKNASVGDVAEKVREASAGQTLVEPGRWESKVTVSRSRLQACRRSSRRR